MGILKIRDEDGIVRTIASIKGEKGNDGVGVPEGGTKGQVIKRTEEGAEWGNIAPCEVLLQNSDISIDTFTIEKRGLYEVKMFYSTANLKGFLDASTYVHSGIFLISVSDLDKDQWVASLAQVYMDNGVPKFREAGIKYENKTFTATYFHVIVSDTGVESTTNKRAYLAEIKLIIPYE